METISVSGVRLTYEEYSAFVLYNAYMKGKFLRLPLVGLNLLILFLVALLVFLEVTLGFSWFMTLLIAVELALPFYRFYSVKQKIKPKYEKLQLRNASNSFELRADGLRVDTAGYGINGSSDLKYSDLERVVRRRGIFYLFTGDTHAFLLPERALEPAQTERLDALLREKLHGKYTVFAPKASKE